MKTCAICKDNKPLKEFYRNASYADGRSNWCKKCETVKRNGYKAQEKVKEGYFDVDAWAKTELWQPSIHQPDAGYKKQYRKRKAA